MVAPTVILSTSQVNQGQKVLLSLYAWLPNHNITISVSNTITAQTVRVNDQGFAVAVLQMPNGLLNGSYSLLAQDAASGQSDTFNFSTSNTVQDPPLGQITSFDLPLWSSLDGVTLNRRSFQIQNIAHVRATFTLLLTRYSLGGTSGTTSTLTSATLDPGQIMVYANNTNNGNYDFVATLRAVSTGYASRAVQIIKWSQSQGTGGTFSGGGIPGQTIDVMQPINDPATGAGFQFGDLSAAINISNLTAGGARFTGVVTNTTNKSGKVKMFLTINKQDTTQVFNESFVLDVPAGNGAGVDNVWNLNLLSPDTPYVAKILILNESGSQPLAAPATQNFSTLAGTPPGGGGGSGSGGLIDRFSTWFNSLSTGGKATLLVGGVVVGAAATSGKKRSGVQVVRA